MSLSPDHPSSSSERPNHQDGAYAAWGLIITGLLTAIPALVWGGRWYAIAAFAATAGWFVGALIDRARR